MTRPLESRDQVAIIGMAGRFPGAADLDSLWRNLRDGVESISFFSDEERALEGASPARLGFVPAGGVLDSPELFDAEFFGLTPREAELMDPQHRLFLECCWEACEHAGHDPAAHPGRIGIYGGSASASYFVFHVLPNADPADGHTQIKLFNDKDFLTTQASYRLNLRGPSVAVQTACSTSLVAVHLACQAILNGECDMALAGGSSVSFPHRSGYPYQEGGIASPDGHCRAFDANARGMVPGNGVGVVLLRRLDEALADGDTIHAVIRGSAINNDGAARAGFTAPGVDSQTEVVLEALTLARIDPETVGYIEAHGSGTPLGDSIEVEALTRAFRASTQRRGFCSLGSVKTNFGHAGAAAGIAGLLKAVLALKHRQIPPTLHFERPNPQLRLDESPFHVNTRLQDWPTHGALRRAGVNSLGLGGTNAHVVLEEAPETEPGSPSRPWQLLLLSARSAAALEAASISLVEWLRDTPGTDLADVAHTLRAGRRSFAHRSAFVYGDRDALPGAVHSGIASGNRPGVTFLLPGLGDHSAGMGAELYRLEPAFRQAFDDCARILEPCLGIDLRESPPSATPPARTDHAHAALFALEYSLANLWMEWGIRPSSMIGYSLGEYVAACLAGVFSLEDALTLVALRGRLVDGLPEGAMLAVPLPAAELKPLLAAQPDLSLCAANGPGLSVAGGTSEATERLESRLKGLGLSCLRLRPRHAFHSWMMEPVLPELARLLADVPLSPPRIPFVSGATGTWITDAEATDPAYWVRHLRQTVRFGEALDTLLEGGAPALLVEVGPGQALATLAQQHPLRPPDLVTVSSLPTALGRHVSEQKHLLEGLGRLWVHGEAPDWKTFSGRERRRRVPLPTYPFERRRFLLPERPPAPKATAPLERRGLADWFYQPVWEQASYLPGRRPVAAGNQAAHWLLWLGDPEESPLGVLLAKELEERGQRVELMEARVAGDLRRVGDRIVHLGSLTRPGVRPSLEDLEERGFYHLLGLAWELAAAAAEWRGLRLTVVSNGLVEVTGDEELEPGKNTLLGPCRVLPQELPGLSCSVVDVVLPHPQDRRSLVELARRLADELLNADGAEPLIALRGRHRWVQRFRPLHLERDTLPMRPGGVWLVSGGLSEAGVQVAELLYRTQGAKLALLVSGDAPSQDRWQSWLDAHDAGDELALCMRRLLALQESGCDLLAVPVDLTQRDQVEGAVSRALRRFGGLQGVVHTAFTPGAGLMARKTREQAASVLAPSVRGTLVLAEATEGLGLEAFVLFGSNTSVVGGAGQSDTCAAAAFLDAFAQARTAAGAPFTQVLDWGSGISPAELGEAWQRALTTPLPRLVVSTRGLDAVQEEVDTLSGALLTGDLLPVMESGARPARPDLRVPFTAPRSQVERLIAGVWQEAFGIDLLGVHDDFFELSGNSLMAIQIASRLSRALGMELSVAALLASPTIAELALTVEAIRGGPADEPLPDAAATPRLMPLAGAPAVTRRAEHSPCLLSIEQERLWGTQQRDPSSPIYNIYQAYRLRGRVRIHALAAAIDEVVRRHEILRTTFPSVAGGPVQVIAPFLSVGCPLVDLRGLPHELRLAEAERAATAVVQKPFDITRLPLLRLPLVQMYEEDFLWVSVVHHLVTDRISSEERFGEIGVLYQAFAAGLSSPLPEPPFQFADFAAWQRGRLAQGALDESLAWWRARLNGAPELLPLPVDRPRPPVPTGCGARRALVISRADSEGLRALAQREGTTLFVAGLAAWKSLLVRITGAERLIVGTPMDYREDVESRSVQGFFLNQLCLDSDLAGDPPFRTVLRRVRETALDAYSHRDLPFTCLVKELLPEPDPSHFPFTQAVFLLIEPPPGGVVSFPDIDLRPFWVDALRTQYDSMLAFNWVEGTGLVGFWEYSADLFEAATIDRMTEQFRSLLAGALADPDCRLRDLPLLGEPERRQLLTPDAASLPAVEEQLIRLWSKVLKEAPDAADHFFRAGGDSLQALQLASRVSEAFAIDFPPECVLRQPRLAEQARDIAGRIRDGARRPAPIFRERSATGQGRELSFAQQRLWFFDQLEPGSTAYNNPSALRLQGHLDVKALERVLAEVARRHEILRTVYEVVAFQPVQRVLSEPSVSLPVIDLGALGEAEREAEIRHLVIQEQRRPFDLSRGPILRCSLLRLDAEDHLLLSSLHHIASDAWSMGILTREVAILYGAFVIGRPSPLPELPIQYADFAEWQRRSLKGAALKRLLDFWGLCLARDVPPLDLPGARPRSGPPSQRGARRVFRLRRDLSQALRKRARDEGVTLYMLLLAGFGAWLHRATGEDDLVVGAAVAGRNRLELEEIIGFFVNILPLRLDLSGAPTFSELLRRVEASVVAGLCHQDLPLDLLVSHLRSDRLRAGQPPFHVLFGLNNVPMDKVELPGLRLTPVELQDEAARFDLTLWVREAAEGLEVSWTFSTDLFDAPTVERLQSELENVLACVASDPAVHLQDLSLLAETGEERDRERQARNAQRLLEIGRRRQSGGSEKEGLVPNVRPDSTL